MRARALLSIGLLSVVSIANAQTPPMLRGDAPTRPPEIPTGAMTGEADATAVSLDAANLGYLPSWSLVALHTQLDSDGIRGPGGTGFYFGSRVPFVSSLALGAAVEVVSPPDSYPYRNEARLSLAMAYRLVRNLSLGATYTHVLTGETLGFEGRQNGLDTLDLSLSARIGNHVAMALVVHDLPAPEFQGLSLQRVYQPEIAIRPLGNDRWEMALSARIGERRGDLSPMLRITVMPYSGVSIRGAVELWDHLPGDGRTGNEVRATLGLQLDLARFGIGGYALFGTNRNGSGIAGHGFAVTARVSGDRYPSLYTPSRMERIDIHGADDRERVRMVAHLSRLERDDHLAGVIAVMGTGGGSWASMEELRDAFKRLRAAGKHVYVFAAELSTKTYYAAAAAERIYLDPGGGVRFVGMSSTAMYFKGTLDELSVKADFVKIAEYKSAPEQFTRGGGSEEAKLQKESLLEDISSRVIREIAADRKLDVARVTALRDEGPFTATEAVRAGLVDELRGGEQVEDAIGARLGTHVQSVSPGGAPVRPRRFETPAIATLFVDGEIVEGKSQVIPILEERFVGHETLIHAIEAARSDPRVKAILLRVNSPGGSALGSDLVARELLRTRQLKPVICSFGDVAASGGYYIAAFCDVLFAEPSTITGSIGIFTGKFDVSGLAARLGVGLETSGRGKHADMESNFRPYTDEERALILEKLRYYYGRFTGAVAAGRRMKNSEVDSVGRGRVWTGGQAKEVKLVDRLGGFVDALREAKGRAGLGVGEEVEIVPYPDEPTGLLGELLQLVGIGAGAGAGEKSDLGVMLGPLLRVLKGVPGGLWMAPSTAQARMEGDIVIE